MKSLYQLSKEYDGIFELLEEEDANLTEMLDSVSEEIDKKVESLVLLVRETEARKGMVDGEISRLQAKSKTLANKSDELKKYIKESLDALGMKKAGGALGHVTVQPSNEKVEVVDVESVPDLFKRATLKGIYSHIKPLLESGELEVEISVDVDKKKVMEAHKQDDFDVPGTEITRGTHIVVR